jgi:hypothetical protein
MSIMKVSAATPNIVTPGPLTVYLPMESRRAS